MRYSLYYSFGREVIFSNHSDILWSHHFAFNVIIVFSSIANFELPNRKMTV